MKKIYFLAIPFLLLATGCDSYLDRQPDDAKDLQAVFRNRDYTERYLYNVLSFMPIYWNPAGYSNENPEPWWPASDEGIFSYNRDYIKINNGSINPADVPYNRWNRLYSGIREANIFIANVDFCEELTPTERLLYHSEARFARAYYYYLLMRQYGPVILVGDEIYPHDGYRYDVPRNTWDECIEYVERELTQLATLLPPEPARDELYGKPTSGAALGVKAQLLLMNASPLYNPREGETYIYRDMKNNDGTLLFPQSYDERKWMRAAEAAREVINSGVYSLVTGDTYTALRNIYYNRWNTEVIFGRSIGITGSWIYGSTPRQLNGYGGHGITQNLVDAYGMASSGRYPITGYTLKGDPVIDPLSGYSETGFNSLSHPIDGRDMMTYQMYIGRDPRFYMNTIWAGMEMTWGGSADNYEEIVFYYNSSSGPGKSHDYAPAGYVNRKISRRDNNPKNRQWGDNTIVWPYLRLAEIYLSYAEAVNEYDPGNPDILTYVNMVRDRAGMKKLEEAYPELNLASPSAQAEMREMIKKERRIELSLEAGQRYFDVRRWMDALNQDRNIYGMNVFATGQRQNSGYWNRIVVETRVFEQRNYLYPIAQTELNRNKELVQNYGW